jgi:uncharacterized protein
MELGRGKQLRIGGCIPDTKTASATALTMQGNPVKVQRRLSAGGMMGGMDPILLERIKQTNPWLFGTAKVGSTGPSKLPRPWVERKQIPIERLLKPGKAHLIVGPRQAGKSSLIWSVLKGVERPLFLNLEEPVFREWCLSPAAFLDDLEIQGLAPEALFLEEAQWLSAAALFIKGLVDLKPSFPILVSGSASLQFRDKSRESLAGRATRNLLLPFSLAEVCQGSEQAFPAAEQLESSTKLRRQLCIGGYPEAWLHEQPGQVLGELVQAFLLRDASDLFAVTRLDAYRKILRLAAGQIGNLVNAAEYASIAGVSANTVARYLALMEEAHILHLLPAFAGGKRREVTSAQKVYFIDNGLRNALLGRLNENLETTPERGALVENWVFSELMKAFSWPQPVRYWRSLSGAEVDFVLDLPGNLVGIEVKASQFQRPKLSRSSRSFIEAYSPPHFFVVNNNFKETMAVSQTQVHWIPAFLLPSVLKQFTG